MGSSKPAPALRLGFLRPEPPRGVSDPIFRGHIQELDGLRACGLAMVLLNHFFPRSLSPLLWHAGLLAWIAMDSFFVLSGFLIAGILLDARGKPDYYRSYFLRRSLRIFPLYYLVIGGLSCAMLLWNRGEPYAQFVRAWGSPLWFFAYLGNVKAAMAGAWPPFPGFVPLWSLQLEEQFYLLLPFAVRHLKPEALSRLLVALMLLSPALRIALFLGNPANHYPQYVLLPCHMEGLALGAWIAIRFRKGPWELRLGRLTLLTFGLLAATCLASAWSNPAGSAEEFATPFNRTFGYLLSSLACSSVLLWLIRSRGSVWTAWLRIAPVQYLGKISYGVYLLHHPVREGIYLLRHALGWTLPREGYAMALLAIVATIACASVSWHLLESPLMKLKDRLAPACPPPASGAESTQGEICPPLQPLLR